MCPDNKLHLSAETAPCSVSPSTDLNEFQYDGIDVLMSSEECKVVLTCNRIRFILVLERPTHAKNDDVLEEWFRKLEDHERNFNETLYEECVEDFQQSAIAAGQDMISSLLASDPALSLSKKGPQSLEDVIHPLTYCFQLFSEQGVLRPYRLDDCTECIQSFEPVGWPLDSFAVPIPVLLSASELDFVEDLYTGLVLKVSHKGKEYIFKRAHHGNQDQLLREIRILQQISKRWKKHDYPNRPSVPRFVGLVESHNQVIGFLEEFIDGVQLSELDLDQIPTIQRRSWKQQITQTLKRLHEQDFVWGDVKAQNVLLDIDNRPWLIDFGGSTTEGWVESHLEGTKEGDLQGLTRLVQYLGLRK